MPFLALIPIGVLVSLALTVVMTAIQYGLAALAKKPKPQTFLFDDDTLTRYDPLAPWKILNGEGRTGGTVVYKRTNLARTNMWMVVAIGPGPIKSFGDLWMGDEPVFTTGAADGEVQGRYATKLFVWTHLGDPDQTVDTNLQTAFPEDWTVNHRLRGIAYFVLKFVNDSTLYGRGIPSPSIFFRGLSHADPRTAVTGYTDNPVLCIRSWLMNMVWGRRQPASRFDAASIIEEANFCDEYVATPIVRDMGTVWQAQTFTAVAATDILTYGDGWSGQDREHGLRYNDPVQVSSTTTLPVPLAAVTTYFALPESRLTTKLAATPGGAPIDITTAGVGTHTMRLMGYRMTLGGDRMTRTLATAATDEFALQENATNFYPRFFTTGTKLQLFLGTGGVVPAGASIGVTYFANKINERTLELATSANGGGIVNITTAGTQPVGIKFLQNGGTFQVLDVATDKLVLAADYNFRTGDVVTAEEVIAGGAPVPIIYGQPYFWIATDPDPIAPTFPAGRLATTRWNAERGIHINITSTGGGTFAIFADHVQQDEIASIPTGTIIQLEDTPLGTIGGGVALATEYFVINRGRGVIDLATTLANALADVPITSTSGITTQTYHTIKRTKERRFTLNGSFDTDTSYGEVLQAMLSSIGGYADPSGGKWRILPARYRPPHHTLDEHDMRGGVELTTLLPANKAANTLTGTYTNPTNFDIPANFPTLIHGDGLEDDGGTTIQDEIVLPFTNSEPMAVRLAEIELNRRRRQKSVTLQTDLAGGWLLAVGDSFILDLPGIGQNGQPQVYECTRWALSTEGEGTPAPIISISGRENDPFVYR